MKRNLAIGASSAVLALSMLPTAAYADEDVTLASSALSNLEHVTLVYGPPPIGAGDLAGDDQSPSEPSEASSPVRLPDGTDVAFAAVTLGLAVGGIAMANRHAGDGDATTNGKHEGATEEEPRPDLDGRDE